MTCSSLTFRRPIPGDHERVTAVMAGWWGGRDLRDMLPRVFFEHFRGTSIIVEHEDDLVAFLVGFPCPDHPDEAYIHFAGVHPAWRRAGLGRDVYRRFCDLAAAQGRTVVRAVTAPVNEASVAFHAALGFSVQRPGAAPGGAGPDDGAAPADPLGDGLVRFELRLGPEGGT